MATLSANAIRAFEFGKINEIPVIANDIIYEGAAVGDNASGYARPLSGGDPFLGFAERQANNDGGDAGDVNVRVISEGYVQLPISSLAITDRGKDVFASDDNTFTLTQGSNTRIGYVHRWVSTGYGIIHFTAQHGTLAELTDSSGGTAADTVAEVPSSYDQTTLANIVASLTAKINALTRRLGG